MKYISLVVGVLDLTTEVRENPIVCGACVMDDLVINHCVIPELDSSNIIILAAIAKKLLEGSDFIEETKYQVIGCAAVSSNHLTFRFDLSDGQNPTTTESLTCHLLISDIKVVAVDHTRIAITPPSQGESARWN